MNDIKRVRVQWPTTLESKGTPQAGEVFLADEHDVGRLHHRVGCLDRSNETLVSIIPRASNDMRAEL